MKFIQQALFDELLERATCKLVIDPDLQGAIDICDYIRSREIRFNDCNMSNQVLDCMMKNCGDLVSDEVATRDFKQIIRELPEEWSAAFKNINALYNESDSTVYRSTPSSEANAMFSVVSAPQWIEGTSCHRCKVIFTVFRRCHHCRNCGNCFCAECSNEKMELPQFGIGREVRVCKHCAEQLKHQNATRSGAADQPTEESKSQPVPEKNAGLSEEQLRDSELETQEAEELQLALALSASEAECKGQDRVRQPWHKAEMTTPSNDQNAQSMATDGPLRLLPVLDTSDMDPELARYLNRHYWENRGTPTPTGTTSKQGPASPLQPSAPTYATLSPPAPKMTSVGVVAETAFGSHLQPANNPGKMANGGVIEANASNTPVGGSHNVPGLPELTDPKQEEFLKAMCGSIEFFVNRLQSNDQRGRSIARDTTVEALFLTLNDMHPQLVQMKQAMEQRRAYFEDVQDKLTQIQEAREALNALRQEHFTRKLLEEQEAARLRQIQMMEKLDMMRQQKRETLEQRRQMALQRAMGYDQQTVHFGGMHMAPSVYAFDPTAAGAPVYPTDYQYPGYPGQTAGPGYLSSGATYPQGMPMDANYSLQQQVPRPVEQTYYPGPEAGGTLRQPPSTASGVYSMQQLDAALPASDQLDPRSQAGASQLHHQQPHPQDPGQSYGQAFPQQSTNYAGVATDQSQLGYPSIQLPSPPPTYSGTPTITASQFCYPGDPAQAAGQQHPQAETGADVSGYNALPDAPSHEPQPAGGSAKSAGSSRAGESQLILFD